jgi:predicted RNA-binding Zn-ribbon protein involved in translation (DUF1610 family)
MGILKSILDRSDQEDITLTLLVQKNSQEMFLYPPLDKTLSIKLGELVDDLDFFVSKGFMDKKNVETLKFCPACFSFGIIPIEHCRNCGMPSVARGRVIEHLGCGYKNIESLFHRNGELICPRCGKSLNVEGKDFTRNGLMYKCQSCGGLYETPVIDYHCQKCGEYFPPEELGETLLTKYEVVYKKLEQIKSVFKALELLEKQLVEKGYTVKRATQVTGISGVTYDTDLYLTSSGDDDSIIVETYMFEETLYIEEILRLQALKSDLNLNRVIIITNAKLDPKAETLANFYNMIVIVPEKTEELTKEKITTALTANMAVPITTGK